MTANLVFFAWNRSVPGREQISAEHFGEFVQYLGGLQQAGAIQSFDIAFLDIHGGDMNGFILIRGASSQLNDLVDSEAWVMHMLRAGLHMEGAGVVRGVTGELVMERMGQWVQSIPQ